MKRISIFLIIISLIFNICPYKLNIYAIDEAEFYEIKQPYSDYYEKYNQFEKPENEIKIMANDYKSISDNNFIVSDFEGKENILILDDEYGTAEYNFYAEKSGVYSVLVSYCAMLSDFSDIHLSLEIDGDIPYSSASEISLSRVWQSTEHTYDIYGNENISPQIQKIMWKTSWLNDCDGLFNTPLIFYLEKGFHTVKISSEKAYFALEYISFKNPEKSPSYKEYSVNTEFAENNISDILIRIEGENNIYTSDPSLCSTYDRNDSLCSPADPVKRVFNTFGNELWKKSFQSATWEMDIQKDGWYNLGIKYKQDEMRGVCTNRRIYIDDKVPFEEFEAITFPYTTDWEIKDCSQYPIYLTEGKHTITFEAVAGKTGEALKSLDGIINELNECYKDMVMITGVNPDKYTDYYLHEKIPDLLERFEKISEKLTEIKNNIENLSGYKGSEASQLERICIILEKCIKKPLKIQDYIPQIKENISSVSSWSRTFREQPLEIDYIEISSQDMEFSEVKAGFFDSIAFFFKAFIGSFFNDYSKLSDYDSADTLEVWVCQGRDRVQIIKELTDSLFTEEYGINVNVNLVQGSILEACISGNAPDTALFVGGNFPVNLAQRELTVNLSDFEDYDEISERFHKNADTQYTYNGKSYGLPLSQSWAMMFYRKDILNSLGYSSPPETWTELTDMLPVLNRNYMSVGLVLPSSEVSPITETGHTFASMLLQNGLSYYNEDLNFCSLADEKSLEIFEYWTDLYTEYGFEQTYDPFSRFRTGEYPILIQDYTFANTLEVSAPEIKGLWDFTLIPATVTENGISHAVNSNGSSAVIFKNSDNIENAWKFLKWFTSDEIQTEYSKRIESISGRLGRFTPANTTALKNIGWTSSELEKLMLQREELCEIPVTASSYAVTGNIMNAFRETVNKCKNPYSTMIMYSNDINIEIRRKTG